MEKFDVVQAWIDNVAYSHSRSKSTSVQYKRHLHRFCKFIGKTPKQILNDYEGMRDRDFRRKYAQYIRALISNDLTEGYAPNTIKLHVTAVKSFFMYNDLPLGHISIAKAKTVFHNRDMTKEEIQKILEVSRPRDKAFYCMMAQGGLRPETLCNLRMKHIEPEFTKEIIPCKIAVPEEITKGQFGAYFTFIGEESIKYLRAYLSTRPKIDPGDYLFTAHSLDKQLNSKSMSGIFRRTIERLKEKGMMTFEQKKEGKPRTVRLYNLRKFFRKFGGQAGVEYVNFWMGHKANYKAPHVPASDEHYFSREDVEFHRKLYVEKAMPFLRLETATPSETDKVIMKQAEEIEILKVRLAKMGNMKETLERSKDMSIMLSERLDILEQFLGKFIKAKGDQQKLDRLDGWLAEKVKVVKKRET